MSEEESVSEQPEATRRSTVSGIGGFFFIADDPDGLAAWYEEHLGIDPVPTSYDAEVWTQTAGPTVYAPFDSDAAASGMFGPSGWGINFRVDDLDAFVAQLEAAGVSVTVDPETHPNGRFAQLADPEGTAIQLWEPREPTT